MTKFSNKLKKPCFWPILGPFSQFWGKKIFPENPALSRTTSYEFLATCQISEKTNDTIPRKRLDRRTEGRTDPILQDPSGYHRGLNKYSQYSLSVPSKIVTRTALSYHIAVINSNQYKVITGVLFYGECLFMEIMLLSILDR